MKVTSILTTFLNNSLTTHSLYVVCLYWLKLLLLFTNLFSPAAKVIMILGVNVIGAVKPAILVDDILWLVFAMPACYGLSKVLQ